MGMISADDNPIQSILIVHVYPFIFNSKEHSWCFAKHSYIESY